MSTCPIGCSITSEFCITRLSVAFSRTWRSCLQVWISNMRHQLERLIRACRELAVHGPMKPEAERGLDEVRNNYSRIVFMHRCLVFQAVVPRDHQGTNFTFSFSMSSNNFTLCIFLGKLLGLHHNLILLFYQSCSQWRCCTHRQSGTFDSFIVCVSVRICSCGRAKRC